MFEFWWEGVSIEKSTVKVVASYVCIKLIARAIETEDKSSVLVGGRNHIVERIKCLDCRTSALG